MQAILEPKGYWDDGSDEDSNVGQHTFYPTLNW